MPFPEYSTPEQWIAAARDAAHWSSNATGLERFRVSLAQVLAVLDAEAAGADDAGLSTLSPDQVAAASGVPPRTVRLIRAGLANSGLVSRTSSTSPLTQLQLPRGTTGSGIRTPERTDR